MNYRQIFNPSYTPLGLLVIIILSILLTLFNKNLLKTIKDLTKITFISSSIILIFTLLLYIITNLIIIGNYKIFIEIITKTLINNLLFYGLTLFLLASIIYLLLKIIPQKHFPR